MYVKKGNAPVKEALEKALSEIKEDGSYKALIDKYELTPVE